MRTNRIARTGMLVAVAFVLSYVETLLPINFGIPGIKIGLSNIVVVLCLYESSTKETFGIAMVRIFLTGLTFGNFYSLFYSFAGGILSFSVMYLLKKTKKFSLGGVSVAGGVSHNVGQIIVAMIVLKTSQLIYYLPFLLLSGVIAGVAIGLVASLMVKRLHPIFEKTE